MTKLQKQVLKYGENVKLNKQSGDNIIITATVVKVK